jgi:hypothetical protein
VEGIVEKRGGTIWFAAAGVVAAFQLIATLGLLGPLLNVEVNRKGCS